MYPRDTDLPETSEIAQALGTPRANLRACHPEPNGTFANSRYDLVGDHVLAPSNVSRLQLPT
jgi:hypothetical protein